MKNYRVLVLPPAYDDLRRYYRFAARRAPETAGRWFNRFIHALETLQTNPTRCGFANENRKVTIEVRQLLFGRRPNVYRAVFAISDDKVRVLRIIHSARRGLTRREIDEAYHSDDPQ